jgi:hypothetical protein
LTGNNPSAIAIALATNMGRKEGRHLTSHFVVLPAQAQATRTWVSGVRDDANPCSRTASCKTFAGAISKTAVNGEIHCIDPGGFGTVTITKSTTIDCDGTFGSILASGTNGVIVNATNVTATLRNLNGGSPVFDITGVHFLQSGSLTLVNVASSTFPRRVSTSRRRQRRDDGRQFEHL